MQQFETQPTEVSNNDENVKNYEAPAIIYEGTIGTRAGTPVFDTSGGDIFGSSAESVFD